MTGKMPVPPMLAQIVGPASAPVLDWLAGRDAGLHHFLWWRRASVPAILTSQMGNRYENHQATFVTVWVKWIARRCVDHMED